ncbi:MAG: hypothetical protein WAK91_18910 [Candidatus Acidiferrales bacterium]|jgi:hypothetical protein
MMFPFGAGGPERLKQLPEISFSANELESDFPLRTAHRSYIHDAAFLLFLRDPVNEKKRLSLVHGNGKLNTRSVGIDG